MRTTLRRGALLVALALLALVGVDTVQAQVAYTANTVTSLYYKEFKKNDRFYVFNDAAAAARFEQSGETGVGITKIGVGPNGETVYADNETAMELSSSSTASRRRWIGPSRPRSRSPGATARRG